MNAQIIRVITTGLALSFSFAGCDLLGESGRTDAHPASDRVRAATPTMGTAAQPASGLCTNRKCAGPATPAGDATMAATDADKGSNRPPVARAGRNAAVDPKGLVTLRGELSADPDGDPLVYDWTQVFGPSVQLREAGTATPNFDAPDWRALLVFRLTVSDGLARDEAEVSVTVDNRFPVTVAPADQSVGFGEAVILDASASFDPDGDVLTWKWQRVQGPAVAMYGTDGAKLSFVSPHEPAEMIYRLQVCDDVVCAPERFATVHVGNAPPVLTMPPQELVVESGATVTLQTAASDADGDPLAWQWTQVAGTPVALAWPNTGTPSFVAPQAAQWMEFHVAVTDGWATVQGMVRVGVPNHAPVADAGADQAVDGGALVTLGSDSLDPDDDGLTFEWAQIDGIEVALSDVTAEAPSFQAPTGKGTLRFELSVSDGQTESTDTVTITVNNNAPAASAGADFDVAMGAYTKLAGQGMDLDGDFLVYQWTRVGGPPVELWGDASEQPVFNAPWQRAQLVFELVVRDSDGAFSEPSTVTVNVGNQAPVADAGSAIQVGPSGWVQLEGAGSDADGDALDFEWIQTSGDDVELSDATSASPTFQAPAQAGGLSFELRTHDGFGWSAPSEVQVTIGNVPPGIDAPSTLSVVPGAPVTVSSNVWDDNGDSLELAWTQLGGAEVAIQAPWASTLAFLAPTSKQLLSFQLTATDPHGASTVHELHVTVQNSAPAASAQGPGSAAPGDVVTLDGAASFDADEDLLTWHWKQVAGDAVALSDVHSSNPSFAVPQGKQSLVFSLQVSDGEAFSAPVEIAVTVLNSAPVAIVNATPCVAPGQWVSLDAAPSQDPDGDALTFTWVQLSGPFLAILGKQTAQPTFVAPAFEGEVRFRLVVDDGQSNSDAVLVAFAISSTCQ